MCAEHRYIPAGPGVAATPGAAYSPAVVAGDHCYVSGQLPVDPETSEVVPGGIEAEVEQVLANTFATVEHAGFERSDIVNLTVLLEDLGDWGAMNAAIAAAFPEDRRPARMASQAAALSRGAKVEIQAIAVRAKPR